MNIRDSFIFHDTQHVYPRNVVNVEVLAVEYDRINQWYGLIVRHE